MNIDWRSCWHNFEGATYLNLAAQAPLPKVSLEAVELALQAKKFPHQKAPSTNNEVPSRIRANLAKLIGANPDEIALTTGASGGAMTVAHTLRWNAGDEVLTGQAEFPLQFATWKPLEERHGVKLKVVSPSADFLSAEDLIAALTPRTRLVSVSHVRYNDASLLDAARLAEACRSRGVLFMLDVSQSCGAVPMDVHQLGADFLISAGYKWLLGPYGSGFFWVRPEVLATLPPGPVNWAALAPPNFEELPPEADVSRWDSAESGTYFNFNQVVMDASTDFVARMGAEVVAAHNHGLIDRLLQGLPKERFLIKSPLDRVRRGPYGCFAAPTAQATVELFERISAEKIFLSLRDGNIRVSPHLYNTEEDIDRLLSVLGA